MLLSLVSLASAMSRRVGTVVTTTLRSFKPALAMRMPLTTPAVGIGSPLPKATEHGHCIYLDYQATTPVWPEVAQAATPYLTLHWGNPSSGHAFGRPCAAAVKTAREKVAMLIGAASSEVLFVSCGSEADNHAIIGALKLEEQRRATASAQELPLPHVLTSNIEHPAVTACIESLVSEGRVVATFVPADEEGRVSVDGVLAALRPETFLVTLMHSNNEVGSLQPVAEVAAAVRAARPSVLIHTDAAQSVGKVPLDVSSLGVDLLTLVGHKFGAPKGVGALYIKEGLALPNLLHGGSQERGQRAGTECVVLQVALGKAAQIAREELPALSAHMRHTRDLLAARLRADLGEDHVRVNGPADEAHRLPNCLSIGLRGVRAAELLGLLSDQLAASAGAACHTNHASVSAVLQAMNVPLEFAVGTLRLSTGRHSTVEEVDRAADLIVATVRAMAK
mmetsp:Transcript_4579/g.9940  ORF Transcript_4579/g.9940 Transcript_4579/m.9940 type:complete len:450 (-) Transcript_4579:359-1708(-)